MALVTGGSTSGSSGPGSEIGYDQITALVTVNSVTEAAGTTIITCAAHTFDGSPVLATFFAPYAGVAGAGVALTICLFEGATEIGRLTNWQTPSVTAGNTVPLIGMLRFTPTAASHTYTVTGMVTSSTGTVGADTAGTGKNVAAFIRFTKV